MLPQVRVQERMQCLAMGALPRSITVILTGELADRCKPGGPHARNSCCALCARADGC